MLLAPPVPEFRIVTVLATLFATAASPVSWSAATPTGFVPVVMVFVTDAASSSTTEALLLPLFATTAWCRRGRAATPRGFGATGTLRPGPFESLISATVLHPGKVTAAMFCSGPMATPAGSGGAEQPV